MKEQNQQGDVLMKRINALPDGAVEVKRKNGRIEVMHQAANVIRMHK